MVVNDHFARLSFETVGLPLTGMEIKPWQHISTEACPTAGNVEEFVMRKTSKLVTQTYPGVSGR